MSGHFKILNMGTAVGCDMYLFIFTLETTVSFESMQYDVKEGDGSVELMISLSEAVPFNASLELHNVDDTTTITTGDLCSVINA